MQALQDLREVAGVHAREAAARARVALAQGRPPRALVAVLAVVAVMTLLRVAQARRSGPGLGLGLGISAGGGGAEQSSSSGAALLSSAPEVDIFEALGGLGASVAREGEALRREGVRALDVRLSLVQVTQRLAQLEYASNKGWNVSEARVVPLGQHGYVKRDLPVYKDGFSRLDEVVTVLPRPKSGLFSAEQLQAQDYNMILCLSFNTDMCFDPQQHNLIGDSRKVNRIQNLRDVVWSKHKFCKTISSATRGLQDADLLSFTFPCWVMPGDYDKMVKFSEQHRLETWIAKPRALGAGMGIYIISDRDALEHERQTSNVVQAYLENPHLIEKPGLDGNQGRFKWDMRTYVVVTSMTPLRAYLYRRGLVRISTSPYTRDCKTNITACLTNTSLNKKVEGAQLKDITWSFSKLRDYLRPRGVDFEQVFLRIQRTIGLALLSAESEMLRHFEPRGFKCENCYQLLGVDVIFDADLNAKVVEINGEPNLKCTSNGKTHYDFTKKGMSRDLVSLVYSRKSQRNEVAAALTRWADALGSDRKRLKAPGKKQQPPSKEQPPAQDQQELPDKATVGEDHVRYILHTFREHAKQGNFAPIYPNLQLAEPYGRYLRFLRDKEAAGKDKGELSAHADGRRYRLHQIMTFLQRDMDGTVPKTPPPEEPEEGGADAAEEDAAAPDDQASARPGDEEEF